MTERAEQEAFVHYVHSAYLRRADFLPRLFFHVPNGVKLGGHSSHAMMNALKRQGFVNGVADMLYLQPRGRFAYLALELKTEERLRERTGGLSADQQEWLAQAGTARAMVCVCYGLDQAIAKFDEYMRHPPAL